MEELSLSKTYLVEHITDMNKHFQNMKGDLEKLRVSLYNFYDKVWQ